MESQSSGPLPLPPLSISLFLSLLSLSLSLSLSPKCQLRCVFEGRLQALIFTRPSDILCLGALRLLGRIGGAAACTSRTFKHLLGDCRYRLDLCGSPWVSLGFLLGSLESSVGFLWPPIGALLGSFGVCLDTLQESVVALVAWGAQKMYLNFSCGDRLAINLLCGICREPFVSENI